MEHNLHADAMLCGVIKNDPILHCVTWRVVSMQISGEPIPGRSLYQNGSAFSHI